MFSLLKLLENPMVSGFFFFFSCLMISANGIVMSLQLDGVVGDCIQERVNFY